MTDEIVFQKLPYAFSLAKTLAGLRCFIEHQLLTMTTRDWVLNSKDPTWQALCNYYGLVMQVHLPTNNAYAPLEPCVALVSSGAVIPAFDYPFSWHICEHQESLKPDMVFMSICDCVHYYGNPQGGGDSPLPLTGFDQHLAKTIPANVLSLTLQPSFEGGHVIALDDDQFMSGIHVATKMPDWSSPDALALLERRVWIRWMRDSALGIGLRDVLSPDGKIVVPASAMAGFLEGKSLSCEHCFLVLSAVANGLWDSKLAEPAIARLMTVAEHSPKSIYAFVKALPQVLADNLPPTLTAYRL